MKILLQAPAGRKRKLMEIARELEGEGHEIFLSASQCYGACDLPLYEAKLLGVDQIIHLSHHPFPCKGMEITKYIPDKEEIDLKKFEREVKKIKEKKISLAISSQYLWLAKDIVGILRKAGIEVENRESKVTGIKYLLLGCDCSTITEKVVLVVAQGLFHLLALRESDAKKVYYFDTYKHLLEDVSEWMEKERIKRMKICQIALTKQIFGIFVSTKPGQYRIEIAQKIKEKLKKMGKDAFIVVGDDASSLRDFQFEVIVTTACPRIKDDSEFQNTIVIDYKEIAMMLGVSL